jgi:hypothetical protein
MPGAPRRANATPPRGTRRYSPSIVATVRRTRLECSLEVTYA